ncbi:uncharacterized protein EV154DRAFT_561845 [Mucor mucedo]|uniref:uncharacterized protein n=1 Tax=Mucor mucedo TaxID=29922 RepID=UPI002220A1EE|nr:uncharacterized protein EV154DRAFT_561845 [Mucor mucedo]KAI7892928.1 hypothetical protein EV154DRAFT_561845 [Mucor mucedo]
MTFTTVSPRTEPYNLTEKQVQDYKNDGYLLIEDFFSAEEHQTLENYCIEFQTWNKEKGKWMQYYEPNVVTGQDQLCRIENFTPYHSGMKDYVYNSRLLEVLEKLHGEKYILFKEKVNYKLSGGSGFPPHQDAPAFVQFGQSTHMTVMFSIDATTAANGCLEVVPGSHRNEHERRILPQEKHDGSISTDWVNTHEWKPVHCKAGSVLIFGAYLAHRSGDNVTDKSRKAVYLTYNAAKEGDVRDHYYQEKRKHFPPSYEREEGKDYSKGAIIYNLATPIRS